MFASLEDFRFARWVKRLNRLTQILLSLTLVAGLNYVAARHFQRWDLTPNHRYSLSAETLARLAQNVPRKPAGVMLKLILVAKQGELNENDRSVLDQISTLLKEYEYAAKSLPGDQIPLEIETVDPDRNTTRVQQLTQYSAQGFGSESLPQVIVLFKDPAHGDRARVLTKGDLFSVVQLQDPNAKGYGEEKNFHGENAITSAILDVVMPKADKIYFTSGHGELLVGDADPSRGLSAFGDALTQQNFKLAPLNLSGRDDIPDDATVVAIVSPISAFAPEEVEKLRRYLSQRNGRVLLFLEPSTDTHQNNGLDGLLHEWGLQSPNLLVSERDPSRLTNNGLPVFVPVADPKRSTHPVMRGVAENVLSVVLGPPRPVEVDDTASADARHQVHELLATSNNSYEIATNAQTINPATDVKGPIVVAAISERRSSDAVDLPGGKLLVFGNTDFATNLFFGKGSGSDKLLKDSANYLANHETMLNIRPQTPPDSSLNITKDQFKSLGWRLALLPAAMALFGLGVCWIRSRS